MALRHRRRYAFALIFGSIGSACALEPMEGEEIRFDSIEQTVVGGQADTGDPAVGVLMIEGNRTCTLTAVYDVFALTARHCVQEPMGDQLTASGRLFAPASMKVSFATEPQLTDIWYDVVDYRYHLAADIAVIKLAAPPPAYATMNQLNVDGFVGQQVRIAGYGKTSTVANDSGTKRVGFTTLSRTQTLPQLGHVMVTGVSPDLQVAKLCHGDSGGALFMNMGGYDYLVGVNSVVGRARRAGVSGPIICEAAETYNAHVRVDAEQTWIHESMADMRGGHTALLGSCAAGGASGAGATMLLFAFALFIGFKRPRARHFTR